MNHNSSHKEEGIGISFSPVTLITLCGVVRFVTGAIDRCVGIDRSIVISPREKFIDGRDVKLKLCFLSDLVKRID